MSNSIGGMIGKAAGWSAFAELMAKLVVPISNMLLARLLVPEMFGVVATITMVLSFSELFADAGFHKYLVQHDFTSKEELNRASTVAFWTNTTISMVLWSIIALFSNGISSMIGIDDQGLAIVVACAGLPIIALSSIQNARYKRALDYKTLFYVRMFAVVIPFVITIPLAVVTESYWALIIGTLSAHISNAVVLTLRSEWRPSLFFDISILKKMYQFSMWTMLESMLLWLQKWGDTFIVSLFLSSYYIGLFRTSMSTVDSIIGIVSATALPVLLSSLSRLQKEPGPFKDVYYKFVKLSSIILIPMGVGLFIYSDLAVKVLLGEAWGEAAAFVGIWGLISAVAILFNGFNGTVCIAMGKPKVSVVLQVLQVLVIIPAVYFSVNVSYESLTYTRALVRIVGMALHCYVVWRLFRISTLKVMRISLPVFIASGVMALAGTIFVNLFGNDLILFFSIGCCILIYFAVLISFPSMRREIAPYINKLKHKAVAIKNRLDRETARG